MKARCSRCTNIFQLNRDGAVSADVTTTPPQQPVPAAAPLTPQPPAPPAMAPPPVSAVVQPPMTPPVVTPRPIPTMPPPMPAPSDATRVAQPATASTAKRPSFRNQDPGARAQRLARALVSDIVAYNKEKLKDTAGADAATLRAEFREEIRKSWEEYVEQVGIEMAKSSPFFRDALNEILAKGQKVF
ncbi:MAG TPA: hypothetical protein VGD49_06200 [Longimicrobiales bacterium]